MAVKTAIAKLIIPPFNTVIMGAEKFLSQPWEEFFRQVYDCLSPLGKEQSFQLQNYVTTTTPLPPGGAVAGPLDIEGMQFDGRQVAYILVEFYIQRFHVGATKIIAGGTLRLCYNHKDDTWALMELPNGGPGTSGITFTITSSGQVQYQSSNLSGNKQISKITWRARTLGAKIGIPPGGFP